MLFVSLFPLLVEVDAFLFDPSFFDVVGDEEFERLLVFGPLLLEFEFVVEFHVGHVLSLADQTVFVN